MTNVIPDAGFEAGTGRWACSRGDTVGTVTWEHTQVHAGTGACRLTKVSPDTDTDTLNLREVVGGTGYSYPARGGDVWHGSAWVYNDSDTARDLRVVFYWYDAAGNDTLLAGTAPPAQTRTWYQVTYSAALPAGAVGIRMDVQGRNGWLQGESLIVDDVYLTQRVRNSISSRASADGYGSWSVFTFVDPPTGTTTAYTLTPYTGATPINATLLAGGGSGLISPVKTTEAPAGTHTAIADVTGVGVGSGTWTMNPLELTATTVEPGLVHVTMRWAVKDGEPESSADAILLWGDGGDFELGTMEPAGYEQGFIDFGTHQYPVDPNADQTFHITGASGARNASIDVVVPAAGRAVVTTEDGSQAAVVDIQQWPDMQMNRASAVLNVVGRAEPVVILDTLRLPSSEITFLTRTPEEGAALLEVLQYRGRIHIVSPCPGVENVWAAVLATRRVRLTNTGDETGRLWPTTIQEVTAP